MPTRSIRPFAISGAGRAPLLAVLAVVLALTACPVAQAAPWPLFGGSSGRASFAALESGSPPLSLAWSATAAADRGVWTTPIVTQGARPLVAYGSQRPWWIVGPTSTGNVHLRDARSPAAVIDTAAQRVTPDFQATSRMSPTLVTLADPTDQDRPTTYIAMGTSEPGSVHEVQTFRLRDLAPGPRSDDLSGWGG